MGNCTILKRQSGVSLIATILMLMIFSLVIAAAVSLVTTGANIGLQEEQGIQAFYIADGGLQWTLKAKAANGNFSTADTWYALGDGQFKTDTIAYLKSAVVAGDTSISVDSTAKSPDFPNFPSSGRLNIEEDFGILYNGITGTSFSNVTVSQSHPATASVYPAAKLSANIPNDPSCADRATIDVSNDTGGFDISRSFFIDDEYFLCRSKTALQFQNCRRCYLNSSPSAHPSTRYASQMIISSTGRISNPLYTLAKRVVKIATGPYYP